MTRWTIDSPRQLSLEQVSGLTVQIATGHVDVVATAGQPRLEITTVEGPPLLIDQQEGRLTVHYDDDWGGDRMRWLKAFERRSVTISLAVPSRCPVEIAVASAAAVVSGLDAAVVVRSASGPVTLDGIGDQVSVKTASGDVEARDLAGTIDLATASGDLTVTSGRSQRVKAKTVAGRLTADLDIAASARLDLGSVSGDVTVRLPDTVGLVVDMRSVGGQLGAAFGGLQHRRQPGRATVRGRLGDGSGHLSATTVTGDVALLSRPMSPSGPDAANSEEKTA